MTVKPILQDMLFILYSAYTVYAKAMMRKVIIYMAAFCCVLLCVIGEFTDGSGDLVATKLVTA